MISIMAAVGNGGSNLQNDVRTIQSALNDVPPHKGGPQAPLVVDGQCGPKTRAAITRYQQQNIGWADGRVDPGGATIRSLNGQPQQKPGIPAHAPPFPGAAPPANPGQSPAPPNPGYVGKTAGTLTCLSPQCRYMVMNYGWHGAPAGTSMPLPYYSRIATGPGGSARFVFNDGTSYQLGGNSLLVIATPDVPRTGPVPTIQMNPAEVQRGLDALGGVLR